MESLWPKQLESERVTTPKSILTEQAEHLSSLAKGQLLGVVATDYVSEDKLPVEVEELLPESRGYLSVRLNLVLPQLNHHQIPFLTVWHSLEGVYPIAAYRTFETPSQRKRKRKGRPKSAIEALTATTSLASAAIRLASFSVLDGSEIEEYNRTRKEIENRNRFGKICSDESDFLDWLKTVFQSPQSIELIARLISLSS